MEVAIQVGYDQPEHAALRAIDPRRLKTSRAVPEGNTYQAAGILAGARPSTIDLHAAGNQVELAVAVHIRQRNGDAGFSFAKESERCQQPEGTIAIAQHDHGPGKG